MESPRPEISVILVTFNSHASLTDSLTSLKQSDISGSLELIVVDNNSTDNSLQIAQEIFPDAVIIKNSSNVGFAAACNMGAETATGGFLLFYNPDLTVDPEAVSTLKQSLLELPDAGCVTGRMRFPDNSFQSTCRMFPTYRNIFFSRGSFLSRLGLKGEIYTLPDYDKTTEVPAVAGTLLMIKKELFDTIGRFDERFFMYMEDTDLSYCLVKAGYKNYYIPSAGGVHLWGKGSSGGRLIRAFYHHRSVWKYFLKHFPNPFTLLILPLLLLVNFIVGSLLTKRS